MQYSHIFNLKYSKLVWYFIKLSELSTIKIVPGRNAVLNYHVNTTVELNYTCNVMHMTKLYVLLKDL